MYQNQLQTERIHDVVNINKKNFKAIWWLVCTGLINNQDPHSQIENDEKPGAEYPNESNSEVRETTSKTSALFNFMPQMLPDDKIADDKIRSKEKSYVGQRLCKRWWT